LVIGKRERNGCLASQSISSNILVENFAKGLEIGRDSGDIVIVKIDDGMDKL
jgi:hypothetical protein